MPPTPAAKEPAMFGDPHCLRLLVSMTNDRRFEHRIFQWPYCDGRVRDGPQSHPKGLGVRPWGVHQVGEVDRERQN